MRWSRIPQARDRRGRDREHDQAVIRVDEIADEHLPAQRVGNRERQRRGAEDHAQRLLGHHREPERQEQAERGILAIEAAEQEALDDEPDERDQHRRDDERAAEAQRARELDREVRAERVERAVREVDEPAQRKDQREPERDQQVVRADEQAVDDLLEDLDRCHGMPARTGRAGLRHAGIVQLLSSRVGRDDLEALVGRRAPAATS